MKVYTHDYSKPVEAERLIRQALHIAQQMSVHSDSLISVLEHADEVIDKYLASDNLTELDSSEIYNGFVPYNDIEHLIK